MSVKKRKGESHREYQKWRDWRKKEEGIEYIYKKEL